MKDELGEMDLLREAIAKQRGYADFFGWPDRLVKERGVVAELFSALLRDTGVGFTNLRSRGEGEDPPDCESTDPAGALVGIEVTELVDEGAIHEARKRNPNYWAPWSSDDLVAAIQKTILRKGETRPKGGPYSRYLLVIHTDEPNLSHTFVQQSLAGRVFSSSGVISGAYLLLSYDPQSQSYPYFSLALAPAG